MRDTRTVDRQLPQDRPFTPSPDGFERRERGWVGLPEDNEVEDEETSPRVGAPDAS